MKNKKKQSESNSKRNRNLIIWMVIFFILGSIMVSFAFLYEIVYIGQNENKIKTCSFNVSFKDYNPIRLDNTYPMSDGEGKTQNSYNFYIRADQNNCPDMTYNVKMYNLCDNCVKTDGSCLIDNNYSCDCNNQIDGSLIKYELKNKRTGKITTGINPYNMNVTNTVAAGITDNYELRLWIDENATNQDLYIYENNSIATNADGTYKTKNICLKLSLNNKKYKLDQSGANAPELATNMVPVYYDSSNNTWRIADKTNRNVSNVWYDYNSKMWANAVMVKETGTQTRAYYNNQANVGQAVSMDDILAMYVWIPRFSATMNGNYNGGTQANPGAFNITFVNKETAAHDAFTFGTQSLSGIWVGKFETSHTTLATSTTADNLGCSNETCNNANGIVIKPNVVSLRYNNVSNFFFASRSMQQSGNSFGFDTTIDTTLDSHMMKNNEWGAVAYLTQSNYGRCTNGVCTEVTTNNCTENITGIGGDGISDGGSSTTCTTAANKYDGEKGVLASTTGNIYGVYDMSGGVWEYVMSNYNNTSGYSGFSSIPNLKYINIYTTESAYTTANLQHALVEAKGWYSDSGDFLDSNNLWYVRSGANGLGTISGIFYYSPVAGTSYKAFGSRYSLSVK